MELLQLRYFCIVSRNESITKAAEEIRISQPALSKSISTLENELGVQLFDRVKKKIVLNEHGKYFYEKVLQSIKNLDLAVEELRSGEEDSGTLSLIVKAGMLFLPKFYDSFIAKHPNIKLEIANLILLQRKLMSEYDFNISASFNSDTDTEQLDLMREEMVLLVSKEHWLAGEKYTFMKDLKEEYFIQMWRGSSNSSALSILTHIAGFTPKISGRCSEIETVFTCVREQKGIALIPYDSLTELLDNTVVPVHLADKGNYRVLKLRWYKKYTQSKSAEIFKKFIVQYFQELEQEIMQEKRTVFQNNTIQYIDFPEEIYD